MSKIALVKSEEQTVRTPERAALAQSLANLAEAQASLSAAQEGVEKAFERKDDAQRQLDALRTKKIAEPNVSDALIASLKSGDDFDIHAAEKVELGAREEEQKLEREIELWRKVQASCEASVEGWREALAREERLIDRLAAEVLRAEVDVPAFVARYEELHRELADARRVADFLLSATSHPGEPSRQLWTLRDYGELPKAARWKAALAALRSDADALLPMHAKGN